MNTRRFRSWPLLNALALALSPLVASPLGAGCSSIPPLCDVRGLCAGGADGETVHSGGKVSTGGKSAAGGHWLAGAPGAGGVAHSGGSRGSPMGGEGGVPSEGGEPYVEPPGLSVQSPALVRLRVGASLAVPITIERTGGLEDAVKATFLGLPDGVLSDSDVFVNGSAGTKLALTAAAEADTGGPYRIQVAVTSLDGELTGAASLELVVAGAAGTPDTSFGEGGLLRSDLSGVTGLGLDADRQLVVAGSGSDGSGQVMRSAPDGKWQFAPDFEFPNDGKVGAAVHAMATGTAGFWLGVGSSSSFSQFGVRRYDWSGQPSAGFGESGFAEFGRPVLAVVERSGRVFVLVDGSPAIVALDDEGKVDASFQFYSDDCVDSIAVDLAGRLLVKWCDSLDNMSVQVSRVLPDGSLDESYGTRGTSALPVTNLDADRAISDLRLLDSNEVYGGIGFTKPGDPTRLDRQVFRLNDQGSLDADFGTNGILLVNEMDFRQFQVVPLSGGRLLVFSDAIGIGGSNLHLYDDRGRAVTDFGETGAVDPSTFGAELGFEGQFFPLEVVEENYAGRLIVVGRLALDSSVVFARIWL